MAITLNGTTGISGVDGSAGTPAVQGADSNTGIFFPAADTIAFTEGGTEVARLDSAGTFLVGKTTTNLAAAGVELFAGGTIYNTVSGASCLVVNRLADEGTLISLRQAGTGVGSLGVTSGELFVDGSSGDCGIQFGGFVWKPRDNGAAADNVVDIGNTTFRFDDIYATNGTIQTSDRNEKQDIEELNEAEQRVAVACKGLMRKYRWKDAVAEKGDDARTHFGIIAQDLQAAFAAEGLDAGRYAMFIHSTWTDEETGEERSRMGVRYSELLAFIIAAI